MLFGQCKIVVSSWTMGIIRILINKILWSFTGLRDNLPFQHKKLAPFMK